MFGKAIYLILVKKGIYKMNPNQDDMEKLRQKIKCLSGECYCLDTDTDCLWKSNYDDATPEEYRTKKLLKLFQQHQSQAISKAVAEAKLNVVTQILSTETDGLFDEGDLFIKREPLEQTCVNIVGYETFKAIQESLPELSTPESKSPRPEPNCTISGHIHKAKNCPESKS